MHKHEDAAIKQRNAEKAAAIVHHEELKELQGLLRKGPTGERCVELMAKHGFEASSVRNRIIGQLEEAAGDIRKARKDLLDALVHAVMVNASQSRHVHQPRSSLDGVSETIQSVAAGAKSKYEKKAARTRQ